METVTLTANSQAGAAYALREWMKDIRPVFMPPSWVCTRYEVRFEDNDGTLWAAVDLSVYLHDWAAFPLYESKFGGTLLRGDTNRRRAHMGVRARWDIWSGAHRREAINLVIYRSMRMFRETQETGILVEGVF